VRGWYTAGSANLFHFDLTGVMTILADACSRPTGSINGYHYETNNPPINLYQGISSDNIQHWLRVKAQCRWSGVTGGRWRWRLCS